jgi:hypothetical protein
VIPGEAQNTRKHSGSFILELDLHYRKRYCDELQFSDLNASDLEKLNKTLFLNGNSNCEYITTQGKGYHSWNILEVPDAIEWIERICN